jgi:hypothetical protein
VISQGGSGRGVNLVEVARDAELLDQLATRAAILDDDAVSAMLASFAAEVDEGLAALLDEVDPTGRAADRGLVAVPDVLGGRRRGHGLRATTIAVVLGATLSVSGVAAAMTGDPLSPYKGIVSAVQGVGNDHQHGTLPSHAARVATMNHKLVGTRAQIAHGDLAGAEATLAGLRLDLASMTDLTTGERSAIEARIAALEAAIGRANGQTAAHDQQPKSGTHAAHTVVPNNAKAHLPSSTKTPEPQNTKTPEPSPTKTPEPNNTKTPDPADTGLQGSGGTHTAEPQNTQTAGPTDPAVGGGGGGGRSTATATATDAASNGGGGTSSKTAQGKGATH